MRARPSRPVIAVPPGTRQPDADTCSVTPAPAAPPRDPAPPAPAPVFDLDAARGMARRLARGIGAARRAHCKDGVPGGLLAPLYLMMDKKDSGCKW